MMLTLTEAGRKTFAAADAAARAQVDALLLPLDERGRERLAEAMRDIRAALEDREAEDTGVCLRPLKPGDVGWIIHRQTVLYNQEYGWDWTYEGLASRILGDFVAEFDPAREDGWIAERRGAIAGSIFLMKSDDPAVAKLRLLYVEPSARGLGIGRALVDTCIARARELGYRELTLWTNEVLVSARRIYQAAGFRLVSEAPAPFVRPRSRRADLDPGLGLTARNSSFEVASRASGRGRLSRAPNERGRLETRFCAKLSGGRGARHERDPETSSDSGVRRRRL